VAVTQKDEYHDNMVTMLELIRGDLFPRLFGLLGQEDGDHFFQTWRAWVVVIDKGEMRQGYCRGRRPVEVAVPAR